MRKSLSGDLGPKLIFPIKNRKLWQNSNKSHEAREVLAEPEIFDAIIATHNSIGHTGQDAIAKNREFQTCVFLRFGHSEIRKNIWETFIRCRDYLTNAIPRFRQSPFIRCRVW